jgi:Tfp pilus assembly protein PilW
MKRTVRPSSQARSARRADEAGLTLVELIVAMTISIILLTLTTLTVTVFTKAEASTVNSANAAANVRLTLLQLQNDIQSADPLGTLGTVAAYNDELQMTVQPSNTLITWLYSYTTGQLTRQNGVSPPAVELTNATNGDPSNGGIPVFSYFDHCSINLVTQPQATPTSISGATTAVQVSLSVANLNSAPYGSTTTVHIMNQSPGASRCG